MSQSDHLLGCRLGLLLGLVGACLLTGGCIVEAVRAIADPTGFAKDLGAATLESIAGPLVTRSEAETIATAEQMVSDLRRIISENPHADNRGELNALADELDGKLATYRQQYTQAVPKRYRTRDEKCLLWKLERPSGFARLNDRDAFRCVPHEVHGQDADPGNGRILTMKSNLLNGSSGRWVGDLGRLDEMEIAAPVTSPYSSPGWTNGPPPDSVLSDPPPPE